MARGRSKSKFNAAFTFMPPPTRTVGMPRYITSPVTYCQRKSCHKCDLKATKNLSGVVSKTPAETLRVAAGFLRTLYCKCYRTSQSRRWKEGRLKFSWTDV